MGKGKKVLVYDLNGKLVAEFGSVLAAARHYNTHHANILYWIRVSSTKQNLKFVFEDSRDYNHNTKYNMYRDVRRKKDVELDRDKFPILSYEVKFKRVSITPCPYAEYPKPMIGSWKCQRCRSFKGINRNTHEVACNRQFDLK